MQTESLFMEYIDAYRKKNKINVTTFCQGICSIRNYSRYLSRELSLPFDVFIKMIHRLGWTIKDFVIYIENADANSNLEVAYFIEYVRNFYFKEAEQYLKLALQKPIPTLVKNKYFPVAKNTFLYRTNKLSKTEYQIKCRNIIKLFDLLNLNKITREDSEALILYMLNAEASDQMLIYNFLLKFVLYPEDYQLISNMYSISLTRISSGLMYVLGIRDNLSQDEIDQYKQILKASYKHYFTDAINGMIVEYISFYYELYKKIDHPDKYQLLKHLLSIILIREDRDLTLQSLNLSELEKKKAEEIFYDQTYNDINFMDWVKQHE